MGLQNEELVEELLWEAYLHDKAEDLIQLATSYMKNSNFTRVEAYEKASIELGLIK